MLSIILSSLYLLLPAYLANMCPIFAGRLKLPLGRPISEKYLGSHKTWRGFYAAYFGAFLMLFIQLLLQRSNIFTSYSLLDYEKINLFLFAFLFGIGALTGDLVKSFFKRHLKKQAGSPWFPFDQLDFVLGAGIFLAPVYLIPWQNFLALLILTPLLHFLANVTAYLLGLKKVWW